MSNKTLAVVAVIAVFAIVFSSFNTYLILDSVRVQEQLNVQQEEQLNELQNTLEQLGSQEEQLNELQSALEQLDAQEERINELQNTLDQLSTQEEEPPTELQDALEQLSNQEEQLNELQSALDEARDNVEEARSDLSVLTNQLSALDQDTTTSLAEIGTTVENLEALISELSNLEGTIDQLLNRTPAEVYEEVYKSVVVIRTPTGQGSGFFFENSNMIATNYHVVTTETDIEIEFFDRTRTQATVIGSDAYSDIAVLSVPSAPAEIEPLNLGDQAFIGQQVVAIGNPLGLSGSLSVGYISQENRLLDIDPIIIPVLQLDLTIAPGSSGGPLLDLSGNVIGITNAGTDVGFNFAVPVSIMKRVIPALIAEGEYSHPLIGVSLLALTPEVVTLLNILNVDLYQSGLLVMEVVPDSPADDAGLNPALSGSLGLTAVDIILAVDGHPTFTIEDLTAYVELEVSPGQSITLSLWRSGVTDSVDVIPMERPPFEE